MTELLPPEPSAPINVLPQEWLPFNRKEQFFTGTVLPMILASNDFRNLRQFLTMCDVHVDAGDEVFSSQSMQFFTEYAFQESLIRKADRRRFDAVKVDRDTPDLVIVVDRWIVVIEAKMFHRPSMLSISDQMKDQAKLINIWKTAAGLADFEVRHLALLPAGLLEGIAPTTVTIEYKTWEEIAKAFKGSAPAFWMDQLEHALHYWSKLAPKKASGANKQGRRTGLEIHAGDVFVREGDPIYEVDGPGVRFNFMGCNGGLGGKVMRKHLEGKDWEDVSFEVRVDPVAVPHKNWFEIDAFLEVLATRKAEQKTKK